MRSITPLTIIAIALVILLGACHEGETCSLPETGTYQQLQAQLQDLEATTDKNGLTGVYLRNAAHSWVEQLDDYLVVIQRRGRYRAFSRARFVAEWIIEHADETQSLSLPLESGQWCAPNDAAQGGRIHRISWLTSTFNGPILSWDSYEPIRGDVRAYAAEQFYKVSELAPPVAADGFPVWAHRAMCRRGKCFSPENSFAALEMATFYGADKIEIDIVTTKDGVPLVFHDPLFDPSNTLPSEACKGNVAHLSQHAIAEACRLSDGSPIPTLAQFLAHAQQHAPRLQAIWLDVKSAENHTVRATAETIAAFTTMNGNQHQFEIIFGIPTTAVEKAYQALPVALSRTMRCGSELGLESVLHNNCAYWFKQYRTGDEHKAELLTALDLPLRVVFWTVNKRTTLERILRSDPRFEILSDYPAQVFAQYQIEQLEH